MYHRGDFHSRKSFAEQFWRYGLMVLGWQIVTIWMMRNARIWSGDRPNLSRFFLAHSEINFFSAIYAPCKKLFWRISFLCKSHKKKEKRASSFWVEWGYTCQVFFYNYCHRYRFHPLASCTIFETKTWKLDAFISFEQLNTNKFYKN